MRSIDNLREWANGLHGVYINQVDHTITVTTGWDAPPDMDSVSMRDHVNGILDGIEREVEELRDRDYHNGREDAKGAVEFADRLKAAVDNREDVTLFGVDYTPLPLDADGVPIHVGDWMELDSGAVEEVESMHYYGSGGWTTTTTHNATAMPSIIRHHHAPTVEDVLREFYVYAERGKEHHREDVDDAVLAEYAAKLRLAERVDE